MALTLVVGTLTLACAQSDVVGPQQPTVEATWHSTGGDFLRCTPLKAASVSKMIVPGKWDTLQVGPHRLILQPSSLLKPTLITAKIWTNDDTRSVKFGPEGLQFQPGRAARLELNVAGCPNVNSSLFIAYTDDSVTVVEESKLSSVNLVAQMVSANISHFSRYAVHY